MMKGDGNGTQEQAKMDILHLNPFAMSIGRLVGCRDSQAQARMDIVKRHKKSKTRRQPQPKAAAALNGDPEGTQMHQEKAAAAAKRSPEIVKADKWRKCRARKPCISSLIKMSWQVFMVVCCS